MHGNQKPRKLHSKLIGYINLPKHVFNGVKRILFLFKEKPDYSFILAENGKVKEIKAEYRRIANQIVEESMIIANICAAQFLAEQAQNRYF